MSIAHENAENNSPEKIAALQLMKKNFYDGLQRRMELFFNGPNGERA